MTDFFAVPTRPVPLPVEPVIELTGVTKVYASGSLEVAALRGIDLRVEQGAYLAIMGPSGSGKSTLMNILGCLDLPTGGIYRLAGEDVGTLDEEQLAQIRNRRIGFVFQQFHLLAGLSAWRNVELPLIYAGVGRTERRERALAALDRVGLADRADHRPSELSGGQQQRCAVARALVTEPAMVLADEPTGNLDTASSQDVLALLDELSDAGSTIVLITHEKDVGDRAGAIVHIRDGLLEGPSVVSAGAPR
jgi:putative ABC transport system ATP-binding protein